MKQKKERKNSLLLFKLSPKSVLFAGAADVPLRLAAFKAFTLAPFVTLLWLGAFELFPLTILLATVDDAFVTCVVIFIQFVWLIKFSKWKNFGCGCWNNKNCNHWWYCFFLSVWFCITSMLIMIVDFHSVLIIFQQIVSVK